MPDPTVTITSSAALLVGYQYATITFTLSDASSNFTANDCVAVNGTLTEFAGSGTVYTAKFTPVQFFEGEGEVTVAANTWTDDENGYSSLAGALSPKIVIDTLWPTVTITTSSASLTRGQTATITFTTSSTAVLFAVGDIDSYGGTISAFSGSGTSYTATFTPTDNYKGNGSVSVAQGKFFDVNGNINIAASLALTINTEPEVVSVKQLNDTTVTETMTDKGAIEWTAKVSYLIKLDARNTNFAAVADNGDVPQVGDNGNFGSRVLHVHTRSFSYYKNNPTMCHVEVQYVGKQSDALTPDPNNSQKNNEAEPDNAAEDPATWQKITVTSEQRQTLLTDHGSGNTGAVVGAPAVNKAGDPIDGLTEDRALVKMVYTDSMVPAPNFAQLLYYVNKVNGPGAAFLGGDKYTVRVMGFSADYDQKGNMWSISLEFLYDPKGHFVTVFNAGFNEKVGGDRKAILTTDGLHPVAKPVLLNANCAALSVADAADAANHRINGAIFDVYPYQAIDLRPIWNDCGLTFVNRF
jgi:hypothetical protein